MLHRMGTASDNLRLFRLCSGLDSNQRPDGAFGPFRRSTGLIYRHKLPVYFRAANHDALHGKRG